MPKTLYVVRSTQTNNFNDPEIMAKIGRLWQESADLFGQGSNVYGVYHQYQSDYKGDYTLSVATENPTEQTSALSVPQTEYRVFPTTREQIVQNWQQIWQLEEAGELQRAYLVDYEQYSADGQVAIYIGLK